MKKILISIMALGTITSSAFAQGASDLYKFSTNELRGTANAIGMGGAIGALGADATAVSINPAGLGVYGSSEIMTTMNFSNTHNETELNAGKIKESNFKFNFDNISFVGVFPTGDDNVPKVNFGFTYNRLKNFDRKISTKGINQAWSLSDRIADMANFANPPYETAELQLINGDRQHNREVFASADWLPILGYNSQIINKSGSSWGSTIGGTFNNSSFMREKGYINSYDFSVGTTISNIVSIGATIALTDVSYTMYSAYDEDFTTDYLTLENFLQTEGSGYQLKVGAIVSPIRELKIGVSYHSPTWYNLTDYYSAIMTSGGDNLGERFILDTYNNDNAGDTYYDYKITTPDRWVFSLAGLLSDRFILSADYELTNYQKMRLKDSYGAESSYTTGRVKSDYNSASTVRVGAKAFITDAFSASVGYAWMQNPIDDAVNNEQYPNVDIAGTVTQYSIETNDTQHITWGLGYTFQNGFYTDVAFVIKNQKADYYNFLAADKNTLKTNTFSGLLTLGYRF